MTRGRTYGLRDRLAFWAGSILGAAVIRGLSVTWRTRVHYEEGARPYTDVWSRPAIFVTWHRRMFGFFDFFGRRHVGVMISLSWDGEIVTRAAKHLGFRPLRGSSTRGGVGGLLGLVKRLRQGYPVGFLADGPRGPLRRAKLGALAASADRGAPIVPVAYAATRAWVLKSWDRYVVPKPFARVEVAIGAPFSVPPGASRDEMEACRDRLERDINRLCERADVLTGGACRL